MKIAGRLDHVAIAAADTKVMVDWYARVLGLVVHAEAGPLAPATQKTYLIGPPGAGLRGGMMIEVMPKNALPRQARGLHDAGLSHTAWFVENFDEALAHLRACNVKFLSDVVTAVGR